MQRIISSPQTHYYKRIFPTIYFGFVVFFFAVILLLMFTEEDARSFCIFFFVIVLLLGSWGYFIMRRFVFDLVDEVSDEGDLFVVKNDGREERLALANIVNVADTIATNPPRITLTFRTSSAFGRKIAFSPPRQRFTRVGTRNPVALDLIDRIAVYYAGTETHRDRFTFFTRFIV